MIYHVSHRTTYKYASPVSFGNHVACLKPRSSRDSRLTRNDLRITPLPTTLAERTDYSALLPTITVPTLVLVGLSDAIYSYEVSEMTHAAIPFSRLVIIPQSEHAPMFERPLQVDLAIAEFAGKIRAK